MVLGRGGKRPGAGRPRLRDRRRHTPHRARTRISRRDPVHVTLRAFPTVANLRQRALFRRIKEILRAAKDRFDARLVHFSLQRNHLHLILEAENWLALSRAVKGLEVRLARLINKVMERGGQVFSDRYHTHVLKTPRETRHALGYVLNNSRKHAAELGIAIPKGWLDPLSSASWFPGWKDARAPVPPAPDAPVAAPRTWLLTTGWRRHGLIPVDTSPRPQPRIG